MLREAASAEVRTRRFRDSFEVYDLFDGFTPSPVEMNREYVKAEAANEPVETASE